VAKLSRYFPLSILNSKPNLASALFLKDGYVTSHEVIVIDAPLTVFFRRTIFEHFKLICNLLRILVLRVELTFKRDVLSIIAILVGLLTSVFTTQFL
jgi:hypothetical protein